MTPPPDDASLVPVGIRERIRRLGRIGPYGIATIVVPAIAGLTLLGLAEQAGDGLRSLGPSGPLLFMLGTALFGALAVLPTAMLSLLGGWAFGFVTGSTTAVAGILVASVLGYVIARALSGNRLVVALDGLPKAQTLRRALAESSFWQITAAVSLIRVSPLFPFAWTNLLMAAAGVRVAPFIVGTVAGLLPRTLAIAWIGSGFRTLAEGEEATSPLFVAGLAATVVALLLLAMLGKRALARFSSPTQT